LDNYDKIVEAVAANNTDSPYSLPPHTIVVCEQNFQQFAGCFAHSGIYHPHKRHFEDENNVTTTKKQKTTQEESTVLERDLQSMELIPTESQNSTWICNKCKKNLEIQASVCCDTCDTWFHQKCGKYNPKKHKLDDKWFCSKQCTPEDKD